MDLFKNEVGRPSNETLKKRRNFKIFISVFAVVAVLLAGFGVYKVFAPSKIEGEGLNTNVSSDNKFVLTFSYNGPVFSECYRISAPKSAKNWKIELKYKEPGKLVWKSVIKRNHYNDGATYDDVCFDQFNSKGTYRVLVKWTKGKNNLTYSTPNKWKPNGDGWKTNLLTGWAYKDFLPTNSKGKLKFVESSDGFNVSHTGSTRLYTIDNSCDVYGGYCMVGSKTGCIPLDPGKNLLYGVTTMGITPTSSFNGSARIISLYSSETCDASSLLDVKRIYYSRDE